jgi:CheY-like chemotaxis protein
MRELSAAYNVPGIAVSGYTDAADVHECTKAGFARHLKKPIDFEALLDAVDELTRSGAGASAAGRNGPTAHGPQ